MYLAEHFGTATSTFFKHFHFDRETNKPVGMYGAYLTDPLKFLRLVCEDGGPKAVGCDCGGGVTKMGVTFFNKVEKSAHFICLVACLGHDKWENMHALCESGITKYEEETQEADCRSIIDVFHYLIDPSIIRHQRLIEEQIATKRREAKRLARSQQQLLPATLQSATSIDRTSAQQHVPASVSSVRPSAQPNECISE